MYKIHAFVLVVFFPIFIATFVKEINSFDTVMQPINPNYQPKMKMELSR